MDTTEQDIPPAVYPNLVFNMDGTDPDDEQPVQTATKPRKKKAPQKSSEKKPSTAKKSTKRKASSDEPQETPSEPSNTDASDPAPVSQEATSEGKVVVIKKTKKGKDPSVILQKYKQRINQTMTEKDWNELRDVWVSDYGLSSDVSVDKDTHHGFVLMDIAKERGITIKGLVAENKKNGVFVQPLPDGTKREEEGGTSKVVYIGKANRFTEKEASKWSVTLDDEK